MTIPQFEANFHGPVKGVVIGNNNTITITFQVGQSVVAPFLVPKLPYHLTGRNSLLQELKYRLLEGGTLALSSLNGLPGVGKTAIAVALAHDNEVVAHFYDGILWAGLGKRPNLLALQSNWATALGFSHNEISKHTAVEDRRSLLRGAIGARHMLLIIDDVWELADVQAFLIGGINCAHIITTRQIDIALDFSGKEITVVPELSIDDGVRLLAELAPKVVADEPDEARELVTAVGGLPLAVVLIGRFLAKASYGEQPRRLYQALNKLHLYEQRLRLEQPNVPIDFYPNFGIDTPLSLLAAIETSSEILDESTRGAFYALSVFTSKPNSFSEEAAQAVTTKDSTVLDFLTDSRLLESPGSGRYTMHQVVADYARLKLGNATVYEERMANYFIHFIDSHANDYSVIDQDINNIISSLDLAHRRNMERSFVGGVDGIYRYMEIKGLYDIADLHLKKALKITKHLQDSLNQSRILLDLGRLSHKRGNYDQSELYLFDGLALAREANNQTLICDILDGLGAVELNRGNYIKSEDYYNEALKMAREIEKIDRVSVMLMSLGVTSSFRGEYDKAKEHLSEALALARTIGNGEKISLILENLGTVEGNLGNFTQAETHFQEAVTIARKIGYRERISSLLENMGALADHLGNAGRAKSYLVEGLDIARQLGASEEIAGILMNLGAVSGVMGKFEDAELYFREGLDLANKSGQQWLICGIETLWGELELNQKKLISAMSRFNAGLEIARRNEMQELVGRNLYGLAQIAAAEGNKSEAIQRGGEAFSIFKAIEHNKTEEVQKWLDTLSLGD